MASAFDLAIRRHVDGYLHSDGFKSWLSTRVKWSVQGFAPGYNIADRQCFTETVAQRIRQKARKPIYWLGWRIWRARYSWDFCNAKAEQIVTDFLREDRVKFGDQRYDWRDGTEIADADMEYWERCP